jgi:gamma-glutamylcyclotransferase (GGCT)/AIG2-like uncharacterized protein YtfP
LLATHQNWSTKDTQSVILKLNYIDISSVETLWQAIENNTLNYDLMRIGAKQMKLDNLIQFSVDNLPERKVMYFAFGSNMNEKRMKNREVGYSKRILGIIKNYDICFNKKADALPNTGYANLVPSQNKIIYGALYTLTSINHLLKLDNFEGVSGNHYFRKRVQIYFNEKDEYGISAMTYLACPSRIESGLKPTQEYMNHLLEGKDILPTSYIQYLTDSFQTL